MIFAALPIASAVLGQVGNLAQIGQQRKAAKAQSDALKTQERVAAEQLQLQKDAINEQRKQALEEQQFNRQQVVALTEQSNARRRYDNALGAQAQSDALAQGGVDVANAGLEYAAKQQQLAGAAAGVIGQGLQKEAAAWAPGVELYRTMAAEAAAFGRILSDEERAQYKVQAQQAASGVNASTSMSAQAIQGQQNLQTGDAIQQQATTTGTLAGQEAQQVGQDIALAGIEKKLGLSSVVQEQGAADIELENRIAQRTFSDKNTYYGTEANRLGREAQYLSEHTLLGLQRKQTDATTAANLNSFSRQAVSADKSTQAQVAGLQAQRKGIQSPGLFSVLNAGASGFAGLYNAGLFGGSVKGHTLGPLGKK